jgi:beta-lactamase regulating signal transducer with metallopeptidase domain
MIAAVFDHLCQSTIFAALAGALTLFFRRSGAHVRYGLWFAASVKFLVPFSLLFALGKALAPQVGTFHISLQLVSFIEEFGSPLSHAGVSLDASPALAGGLGFAAALPDIAAGLWAIGCLTVLILWLSRWVRVQRLTREAKTLPIAALIPVKSAPTHIEPGVIGVFNPVLLLPEGLAAHLSQEEFRAVLAHELCHVRRRDNLTAAVHMLVEALFWFFPLVWWLGARLILEREHACDESALAAGNDPATYAESILKVCKFCLHSPLPCMAGISGADLKQRVEAIMNAHRILRLGRFQKGLLALCASAALTAPLALGFLSSRTALAAGANPSDASVQTIAARQAEQAKRRSVAPYRPTDFDKYVGYYQLDPTTFFHITRRGNHYMTQMTGQKLVEVYPDSAGEFFVKPFPAQITFNQNAAGTVTGLVLHQGGQLHPAKRVDATVAERAQAVVLARIRSAKPSPGTEAALRHQIAALVAGHFDYSALSPDMAAAARRQARSVQMFSKLGAFQSVTFKRVTSEGFDVYDAKFATGSREFVIAPLDPQGRITAMGMLTPSP